MSEESENKLVLKFVKLQPSAKLPVKAHANDSGMDICAIGDGEVKPHGFARFNTGIAAIIPKGYELQVRPRSGLAHKKGVISAFGTIDSGYTGDIGIAVYNHSDEPFYVFNGDRIAQLVFQKIPDVEVLEGTLEELEKHNTDRGEHGFGSTGM